jgi:hypothetical protein
MKASHAWLLLACMASAGTNIYLIRRPLTDPPTTTATYIEGTALVMRPKGGLLEVSSIRSPEVFQATLEHAVFGIPLGNTGSRIRVPAVFRYHVELSPEWRVLLRKNAFIVVAPSVKPSLPVAVDLGKMQQESSGTWSAFTGTPQLDALRASITKELAKKAASRSYIEFQREAARLTVREFVAKWLITQEEWKQAAKYPIHVFFADEPISALRGAPPPIVETQ